MATSTISAPGSITAIQSCGSERSTSRYGMERFMSASNAHSQSNNPYDWIERASEELWVASQQAVTDSEAGLISDQAVARIMTAAVKLYVAKTDGEERT